MPLLYILFFLLAFITCKSDGSFDLRLNEFDRHLYDPDAYFVEQEGQNLVITKKNHPN